MIIKHISKMALLSFGALSLAIMIAWLSPAQAASDATKGYIVSAQPGGTFYIDLGRKHGLREGDVLNVVRPGEQVIHPVTKKVITSDAKALGRVQVVKVLGDELSEVEIVDESLRGNVKVADMVEVRTEVSGGGVPRSRIQRIAVLEFKNATQDPAAGSKLASQVAAQLKSYARSITIVEAENRDKLLNEMALGQEGYLDPRTSKEAGKLLGADAFVMGTVSNYDAVSEQQSGALNNIVKRLGYVKISASLVDVETGRTLFSRTSEHELSNQTALSNMGQNPFNSPVRGGRRSKAEDTAVIFGGVYQILQQNVEREKVESARTPESLREECAYVVAVDWARECAYAVEGDPDKAVDYKKMGDDFMDRGMTNDAVVEYRRALQDDFKNPVIHNKLGKAYYNMGDYEKAVEEYKQATELDTKEAAFHSNLAVAYGKLGNRDQAIHEFEVALTLNGSARPVYQAYGNFLMRSEMYEEAIAQYNKYLALGGRKSDPRDAEVYARLAECHFRMGRYDDTIEASKSALKLDSGNELAYYFEGHAYLETGNRDAALSVFTKWRKAVPESKEAQEELAKLQGG